MLVQERVNDADLVLKLFVTIDDRYAAVRAARNARQLPATHEASCLGSHDDPGDGRFGRDYR